MAIRRRVYEIHRPLGVELEPGERKLSEHAEKVFERRREEAGTGGPLMVGGHPVTVDHDGMHRILNSSSTSIVRQRDPETGYLWVGAYVYVPVR